jgi:hypothetical protein
MLREALDAHPQAAWAGELNNPELFGPFDPAQMSAEDFKRHYERHGWGRGSSLVSGFMLKLDNAIDAPAGAAGVALDPAAKVVFLRRENLLAQVASYYVGATLRRWSVREKRPAGIVPSFTASPEALRAEFERIEAAHASAEKQLAGNPSIVVVYEKLLADPAEWRRVTDFLGLDPVPWRAGTVKQETRSPREVWLNFDALAEAFAGTRWGWMFG